MVLFVEYTEDEPIKKIDIKYTQRRDFSSVASYKWTSYYCAVFTCRSTPICHSVIFYSLQPFSINYLSNTKIIILIGPEVPENSAYNQTYQLFSILPINTYFHFLSKINIFTNLLQFYRASLTNISLFNVPQMGQCVLNKSLALCLVDMTSHFDMPGIFKSTM